MTRLIVNADDFGLTPGVNRAVAESCQRGIVTSTTLMADGGAFSDAVAIASTLREIGIGCHVVLVDGSPILPPAHVTSLVEGQTGRFPNELSPVVVRALRGQLDPNQIEAEVTAQIRKLQDAGIAVSHVDTHKHTHLLPQILRPILRAARSCGVKAIRNPFGRVSIRLALSRPVLWKRTLQVGLLNRLAKTFLRTVSDAGMVTTDGSLGVVATGALDESLFRSIIEDLPEGTWEFVCHPGYNDADLNQIQTRLRAARERELAVLTAESTRKLLQTHGVELISYTELTRG
ncbi:MAG: ChbG/HpnK family deacetylase [Terriglobales bacterium]